MYFKIVKLCALSRVVIQSDLLINKIRASGGGCSPRLRGGHCTTDIGRRMPHQSRKLALV